MARPAPTSSRSSSPAPAEPGATTPRELSLVAWQEFTYWLFKRRIRKWHPARVASDTRRGLERLRELREDENAADPGHLIIGNPDLLALPKTKTGAMIIAPETFSMPRRGFGYRPYTLR